jgi:hypothetical protein
MWGRRRKVHYELTGVIKGFTASRGDANRDSKVCCVLERLLKRNLELIRALALRRAPTYADHDGFGFRVNGRVHSLEKALIGVPSEVDSLHGAWTDGTRDLYVECNLIICIQFWMRRRVSTDCVGLTIQQYNANRRYREVETSEVGSKVGPQKATAQFDDGDALPRAIQM